MNSQQLGQMKKTTEALLSTIEAAEATCCETAEKRAGKKIEKAMAKLKGVWEKARPRRTDPDIRKEPTEALIYATSKLHAAAVLSASYPNDIIRLYNLGFISAAYTTAHEGMELLLKVYLRKVMGKQKEESKGHDLGELFEKWDEEARTKAELAYQNHVVKRLAERFKSPAPKWLFEGSHTVEEVVNKVDAILGGAMNITALCPGHADRIAGFPCGPEVWYPQELLCTKWDEFSTATKQGKSLGFVQAFLKREETKEVFEGFRYPDEGKLQKAGMSFHGPPTKMIDIAQSFELLVVFTGMWKD